jgi:hypothetical protein
MEMILIGIAIFEKFNFKFLAHSLPKKKSEREEE